MSALTWTVERVAAPLYRRPRGRELVHTVASRLAGGEFTVRDGPLKGFRLEGARVNVGYMMGRSEATVCEVLVEHARGAVVYDVGANIGFISLVAASLVGEDGHVHAFEPLPDNARMWRRNLERNGLAHRATLWEAAVAERSGRGRLERTAYPTAARLAGEGGGEVEVEVLSLDDEVRDRRLPPPSLVKVDVEGGEGAVLRGMRETLATHRPLVVLEIHDKGGRDARRREVLGVLDEAGYELRPLGREATAAYGHHLAVPLSA